MKRKIREHIAQHFAMERQVTENTDSIEKAAKILIECYENGNKVLICGNGGSAADAQHFAAELVGRFKKERKGLAAIALTTDTSIITAVANDWSGMGRSAKTAGRQEGPKRCRLPVQHVVFGKCHLVRRVHNCRILGSTSANSGLTMAMTS